MTVQEEMVTVQANGRSFSFEDKGQARQAQPRADAASRVQPYSGPAGFGTTKSQATTQTENRLRSAWGYRRSMST